MSTYLPEISVPDGVLCYYSIHLELHPCTSKLIPDAVFSATLVRMYYSFPQYFLYLQ